MLRKTIEKDPFLYCQPEKLFVEELKKPVHQVKPAYFNSRKAEKGEANVTTVLFDDEIEVIHDRFPIEVVKPLTKEEYSVRGCTALLDAVGSTIKKVKNIQKHLPEEIRSKNTLSIVQRELRPLHLKLLLLIP